MPAQLIDGKQLSQQLRQQITERCRRLKNESDIVPGLAVILVGDNDASKIYVQNKEKACHDVGIYTEQHTLPKTTQETDILQLIQQLNANPKIHGILVQLPLPAGLSEERILASLHPAKDIDGFHPLNLGLLLTGQPRFIPCTPFGLIKMLESIHYDLTGKPAVVVGRSNIVGKPAALLLLQRHATVTICHSRTRNLPEIVQGADVVVAAIGKAHFIRGEWIKPGAVVLDVGINRLDNGKLTGDVDFAGAEQRASFITPVPGGVGPMTITMLLWNTLEAALKANMPS